MKRISAQSAYSLFSLLISLLLIGIITSIAVPNLRLLSLRFTQQNTKHTLSQFINYARNSAALHQTNVVLCAEENKHCRLNNDWSNANLMLFLDKNNNGQREAEEEILRLLLFKKYQAQLIWRSFGNKSYLRWQSNGLSYYQSGHLAFCPKNSNPRFGFIMTINSAGRAYFAKDKNNDGIAEYASGENLTCPL